MHNHMLYEVVGGTSIQINICGFPILPRFPTLPRFPMLPRFPIYSVLLYTVVSLVIPYSDPHMTTLPESQRRTRYGRLKITPEMC